MSVKIYLKEEKLNKLFDVLMLESNSGNSNNYQYTKKAENAKKMLEHLLYNNGVVMINVENNKEYLVYELSSLVNIIGKRYCLCQLIKDNEQYGSVLTKPLCLFKYKNY